MYHFWKQSFILKVYEKKIKPLCPCPNFLRAGPRKPRDVTLLLVTASHTFDSRHSASCEGWCFRDSGYVLGIGT